MKSYIIAIAATGVSLSPLIILCIRAFLLRRDVLRIMSENVSEEFTYTAVTQALDAVNACSCTYVFSIHRTAKILFRGHAVTLVFGPVGRIGAGRFGPTWVPDTCLYALAADQELEWMKTNPDVFSSACLASPYSVFWVKLAALKGELSGAANGSQPIRSETNQTTSAAGSDR